jgi:hypothetical protein
MAWHDSVLFGHRFPNGVLDFRRVDPVPLRAVYFLDDDQSLVSVRVRQREGRTMMSAQRVVAVLDGNFDVLRKVV